MSSRRRILRFALLPAVAALACAGCGGSSHPASTVRHQPLVSIFEDPGRLESAPGPTLDLLRQLGVDDIRVILQWATVAPAARSTAAPRGFAAANPGSYPAAGWTPYDAIVQAATARHVGVLLDVSAPAPLWASGRGAPPGGVPGVWKPSAAAFGSFVHAVGVRYSGRYTPPGASAPLPRVSFWSIWNEPNLGQANLAPQAAGDSKIELSPRMYRGLVDAAWSSLETTGHGHDTILIGELAPYGQFIGKDVPGNFGYMVPMRFVRALYCVDASLRPLQGAVAAARGCPGSAAASKRFARENPALFQASGFSVHPYSNTETTAPNVVLPVGRDFLYLATLSRLERVLDTVTRGYGQARQFPLYSTEYGFRTDPPSPAALAPPVAAEYLNWAEYLSWRMPRLRSFDQYLLVDPPTSTSSFTTGLQFLTGQPKPSFSAFRFPIFLPVTHQPHGDSLEVWGCLRPAHYLPRPQMVRIQIEPAGQRRFETVTTMPVTDPSGYFDTRIHFPSAGQVRLAWSYPHGPTIFSRQVAISAS